MRLLNFNPPIYYLLFSNSTSLGTKDADEAVVYSTTDANVWEKRGADQDADEAVVYSTKDTNVWEKRGGEKDADEAVVYSTSDANVWE